MKSLSDHSSAHTGVTKKISRYLKICYSLERTNYSDCNIIFVWVILASQFAIGNDSFSLISAPGQFQNIQRLCYVTTQK